MMRAIAILMLAFVAVACGSQPSRETKALADARDVERVEAAQNAQPPIVMLSPQTIAYADIEKSGLFGASCVFLPNADQRAPVVLAIADTAYLKIDGSLRIYAADKGSAPLSPGSWSRYEGRGHVIDLQTAGGEGRPSGEETTDWPGRLTIRDPYDRVVYRAAGTVQCGT